MTKEQQGECLKAFRCRIGLENKKKAAQQVCREKGFACDEESARRAIGRHESGEVKPRDGVLAAWSAVATKRGYHRRTGKRTKVLLKEIFRLDSAGEWMSLLEELVHDSELPRELPIAIGFGGPGDTRLPTGAILPNESHIETIHADEFVTHVRCWGPRQFYVVTKELRPMEKTASQDFAAALNGLSHQKRDAFFKAVQEGQSVQVAVNAAVGRQVDLSSKAVVAFDNQVVSTFWLKEDETREFILDSGFQVMEGCSLTDNVRSRKLDEYQRSLYAQKA